MNDWARALAEYAAAIAAAGDPLTDAQLKRVLDAMRELEVQHYAVLQRSLERAKRARGEAT
jgi:chromosome segregation and condensation protein ScpB